MNIEVIDLWWNVPIWFFTFGTCWEVWEDRKLPTPWHLWPWYAGTAAVWAVNVPLEFATNDTVWAWLSLGLVILDGFVAILYFYENKWKAKEDRRRREQAGLFEKFLIDK